MEHEETELCLRWHNFTDTVLSYFGYLRDEEEFVDVTLSCEGKRMRAHKVVLAASSPYLQSLLEENPCKHPCIILDEMPFNHLEALVCFVYTGKVRVGEDELPAFLESANHLRIRGLSDVAVTQQSSGSSDEGTSISSPKECEDLPPPTKRPPARRISAASSTPEVKVKEEIINEGSESQGYSSSCSSSFVPQKQFNRHLDGDEEHSQAINSECCQGICENAENCYVIQHFHLEGLSPIKIKDELDCTLGEFRRRNPPEFRSNVNCGAEEVNISGKRSQPNEPSDSPLSKRPSIPNIKRTAGPPNMPEVNMENQSVNGMTDAEIAAMGGPPPAAFFQQMQFSWRKDFDVDYSQGDARRRHSLDPRPCPVCNRVYSNLSNLRQHLRLIHNPKFVTCHLCSKTFKTDLYLRRHIMSYHELNLNHETGIQAASPIPLSVVEVKTVPTSYCQSQSESPLSSLNNMLDLKDSMTN